MQKFTCAIGFLALVLVLQDFWVPAEGVRVKVIKVKKDKRQAQRGYTDVPLDEGPFDDIENSSPLSTDFGDNKSELRTDISDPENTQVDYSNGYPSGPSSTTSGSTSLSSIDKGSSSIRVEVRDKEPLKTEAATIDEQREETNEGGNAGAIPGDAGLDYPNFATIPPTSFSCKDQNWPGYYADTEARCQVFWICQKNRMDAFLCPNGTLFNQQVFVCDWWFNVDCTTAPEFYSRNQFIYAGPGIGIDGKKLPSRRTNGGGEESKRIITTVSRPAGTNSNPLVDRSSQISTKTVKITSVNNNIYQESASANSPVSNTQRTTTTTRRTTTTPRPTTTTSRRPPPPPIPVRKNTGSKSSISLKESAAIRKENLKTSQTIQKQTTTAKQLLGSSANSEDLFSRPTSKYGPPSQASSTTLSSKYGTPDKDFTERKESSSTTTKSKYTEPDFTPPPPPRESSAATIKAKYGPPPPQGSAATLTQKYGPPDFNSPGQSTTLSSEYGAPGFIPGTPQNFVDESRTSQTFVSSTSQPNSFNSLSRNSLSGFSGQRANQFNNVHGQRENMYESSNRNSVVEYPISPSQQKNKQRLLELASRKDSHMDYQHFHGQRSNAFSDSNSISYVSNNDKSTFIDHSAYSGKKNIFSTPVSTTQKIVFHSAPTSSTTTRSIYVPVSVSTTERPYIHTGVSSTERPYIHNGVSSTERSYISSTDRSYIPSTDRSYIPSTDRSYTHNTASPSIQSSTYTVPDGYAALHAGSYISIATTPNPATFSKKILISAANSKSFSQTAAPKQLVTFTTSAPRNYNTITPSASPTRIPFGSSASPTTINPYFTTTYSPSAVSAGPRYVSGNNNYIVSLAPTTPSYPVTTSAGHRQNAFTGHGSRRHNSFSNSGFSNTINFPGGISETNVRFGLGNGNNIGSTKRNTPYPSITQRFSQAISSTQRPLQNTHNSISTTARYAGAVTNKSTNSNNIIYVDPADTASSNQAPVATASGFGQRISGSARKRMTGAWQNYFNDN